MKRGIQPYAAFLHLALVGLAVTVGLLVHQNRELRQQLQPPPPARSALEVGQAIEAVDLQPLDESGESPVASSLDFASGEKDRLLLVFTTTCPACRANQENWRRLHEQVGDSVDVVGISLSDREETQAYRSDLDLPFPVALPQDRKLFSEKLSISAIPMTIRIGADGRVRGSWLGTLTEAQLAEVAPADRG